MRIRTLVADDHSIVLEGLRSTLSNAGCELLGTAGNGRELVGLWNTLRPELIVLDISMPELNGIDAARQIRKQDRLVRLVFLSMHKDLFYVREVFRAGANGYLLKQAAVSELAGAIQSVMNGQTYISPLVTRDSVQQLLGHSGVGQPGKELTPRQREVLQLVAEGKTAKEVAALLDISVKTVEFHKASIMDALGLRTTAELTKYAIARGIVAS